VPRSDTASAVPRHLPANTDAGVILAAPTNGKAQLTAAIGDQAHSRGGQARDLLVEAATMIGGAGGTGPLASAGGRSAAALQRVLTC